ncbi:uncharacterized protein [Montipora capricornis]|uniref:uncharacterized protein n=1 Tax=Montipora capricornis TaxID=246305 RepID=UPI0035F19EEB
MPQCVEIFNEADLQEERFVESFTMAQDLSNAVKDERKRLEEWRQVRNEQDLQFQVALTAARKTCSTTSSSSSMHTPFWTTASSSTASTAKCTSTITSNSGKGELKSLIKGFRKSRVCPEPDDCLQNGIKIVIRFNGGKKMARLFSKKAFFQEVYDWVGSQDDVPLHFTLQRGKDVVRHSDSLEQDEVLDLAERSTEEMSHLLQTTVSFKGNFESNRDEELSETLQEEKKAHGEVEGNDEDDDESDKGDNERTSAEQKRKRKRKDTRTSKNRRKNKKN